METEKVLCILAMAVAGIMTLLFLVDVISGFPFQRAGGNIVFDILFVMGGGFVLWQGIDTYRELR